MKKRIAWNKGLTKETDERVKKYGERMKGKNNHMWKGGNPRCKICNKLLTKKEYEYCKKHTFRPNLSENTKQKIRQKAIIRLSIPSNNPNWKGGITPLKLKERDSNEVKLWRISIFERDHFTCQMPGCNKPSHDLNAHHIKQWSKYPDLRFDINNGITLCKKCHSKIRRKEKRFENLFIEIIKCKYGR